MSQAQNITTLTEFLEQTGARLRFFDIGRLVLRIPREEFIAFERGELAYPYPVQRQAWFALMVDDLKGESDPFIWFIHFPLDEQGRLQQAVRDDFMHRLVERLGENLKAAEQGEPMESALKDNPYTFKPRDERMALFHARASRTLKQPPSQHYEHARQYFAGELGWEQWNFLGYQGIADLAARIDEGENRQRLATAIPQLPDRPLEALCHCLEGLEPGIDLAQPLQQRLEKELASDTPEPAVVAAILRALCRCTCRNPVHDCYRAALSHPVSRNTAVLAAIGARGWHLLKQPELTARYLERLAENATGQSFFDESLIDLLFVPGMREPLLKQMREPERSEALSKAIGAFFQHLHNPGGE